MRTRKPISTISFNSESYLILKLNELKQSKKISFWSIILHAPEDDEGGKKYHYHVFLIPSIQLQTDDIRDFFKEFDPTNPEKPLGCLMFMSSKFSDWVLYALHDKRYLALKNQSRRFHYEYDDLISSDSDDLLMMYRSIDLLALSPYADMESAISQGMSFNEYFCRGTIPIQQVTLYEKAWYLLADNITFRNGKSNHE